jgi:lambda repressor-like predicted transcriptional regulator
MSIEDAQTLPLNWHRKLTVTKVNEIKKHGLTLSSAAVVLDTSAANLSNFLKRHNIEWPSKGICYKAGHRNPSSVRSKCELAGVSEHTVWAHMRRKGLTLQDAIELAQNAKRRRQEVGKVKHPLPYDLVKRRLTKQEIIECEKLGLTYIESAKHLKVPYMTLVSRINKMGINWRGKGNRFGDGKK